MNHIDRVAEILTSPQISQIHFTCGQQITPALFYKVAHAVRLGKINNNTGIVVGLAPLVAIGAPAKYDERQNTLLLEDPYNDAIYDPSQCQMRSLVVHESVHAIADIQKLNLNRGTTEAAAYLAQTIFILSFKHTTAISTNAADYGGGQLEANIFIKCNQIVSKYNLLGVHSAVSHDDLKGLKGVIHAFPRYSDQTFFDRIAFDGIKGVAKH